MAYRQIPVTSSPNQSFDCTLIVDGITVTYNFFFRFSEIAGYWLMDVKNSLTDVYFITSLPLVPGNYPAANILRAFQYLKIGSAYLINDAGTLEQWPSENTLGTDWLLIWGDTSG